MYPHIAIALLILLSPVTGAHADSWQEREALSHAMRELRAIQALSVSARAVADEKSRIQFDYVQLDADLNAIASGIEQYLSEPLDPVNHSKPLEANYTHQPIAARGNSDRDAPRQRPSEISSTTDTPSSSFLRTDR